MKKFRLLALGIILITGTLTGCGNKENNNGDNNNKNSNQESNVGNVNPSELSVVGYYNSLTNLASKCAESEDLIWTLYDTHIENQEAFTVEDIQNAITRTITECTNAGQEASNLGEWDGDNSLERGVLTFTQKNIAYYSKFSEFLPYAIKGDIEEYLTKEEQTIYDQLLGEVNSLEKDSQEAIKNLETLSKQFAWTHNIKLINNEEENNEEINNEQAINEEINNNEEENIPNEITEAE